MAKADEQYPPVKSEEELARFEARGDGWSEEPPITGGAGGRAMANTGGGQSGTAALHTTPLSDGGGTSGDGGGQSGEAALHTTRGAGGSGTDDGGGNDAAPVVHARSGGGDVFRGSTLPELEEYLRGQIEANRPETEEERRKREKREKWEGIIGGISDMGRALSNLWFTSKGAPYEEAKKGMSEKARERFERAQAERQAKMDRYVNYALKLGQLRDSERNYQFKVEQAREQAALKQVAAEARRLQAESAAAKNDEMAAYYRTKAHYLELGYTLDQAESAARVERDKAAAEKYRHDAGAPYRTSGGGGTRQGSGMGEYTLTTEIYHDPVTGERTGSKTERRKGVGAAAKPPQGGGTPNGGAPAKKKGNHSAVNALGIGK